MKNKIWQQLNINPAAQRILCIVDKKGHINQVLSNVYDSNIDLEAMI